MNTQNHTPKPSRKTPTAVLLAALVAAGLAAPANAANLNWSGATNGNMSGTAANWGGSVPGSADTAIWNTASYTNAPTLNANQTIGSLLFDAGNTAGVTFGASAFTLSLNSSTTGIQLNAGSGAVDTGGVNFKRYIGTLTTIYSLSYHTTCILNRNFTFTFFQEYNTRGNR